MNTASPVSPLVPPAADALLYGLLARFPDAPALVAAARRARIAGYTRLDAFSPFPVEALDEALALPPTRVPLVVLLGAVIGGLTGWGLQYYAAVIDYPWNIGGKPVNSWPMFVPIIFELTILGAGLFGVAGMIAMNQLPQLHHPLFNVDAFARASQDGFFLCIQSDDPKFAPHSTRVFLESLHAAEVFDVPM